MRKILVTGGTVFIGRTLTEYFVAKGDKVYVLNRNSGPQSTGVSLIESDRYDLGEVLTAYTFDVVIDAVDVYRRTFLGIVYNDMTAETIEATLYETNQEHQTILDLFKAKDGYGLRHFIGSTHWIGERTMLDIW